ncbi:MAG: helix-turn-helix domain-containing protein [bacterium]
MAKNFHNRVKELRKRYNLNLQDLEDELQIDKSNFSNYERGKQYPKVENLCKLADYFKVSIDYLLCRTDIENIEEIEEKYGWLMRIINKLEKEKIDKNTIKMIQEFLEKVLTNCEDNVDINKEKNMGIKENE